MARRYIGLARVYITYHDDGTYRGTITVRRHRWAFRDLKAPPLGFLPPVAYDSSAAYDRMAGDAVAFGAYYTAHNRGVGVDVPDWAPSAEVADAIDEATAWTQDDRGVYAVARSRGGKAVL